MRSGRREFLGAGLAGGWAAMTLSATPAPRPTVKPRRLVEGDLLAVVAPSGAAWEGEDVRFALETVESLGFRVQPGKHLFDREAYLAGSDEARAEDLNRAFADSDVAGVIALRGGYGAQRILPLVDYETIAANPKPLVGYSDITALLNAAHLKTGLVTFHGPIAGMTYSDYAYREFRGVLLEPFTTRRVAAPPPFESAPGRVERENRWTTIVGGKARGRLVGGNLTLLSTLMGTPFEPDFADKILFFEDVGEAPYRIDRMLTQLWLAGVFERCAGVAAGKFTEADPDRGASRSVEEILRDRFEPLGKPVLRGLMIGHVPDQTTLPIGVEAELDADAGTLTLLESATAP